MSAVAGSLPAATTEVAPRSPSTGVGPRAGARASLRDVEVLVRRNLIHISREPLQLSDVTIQPVLFTLLFTYVFGSAIPIPGGSYKDFLIPGLLLLNLTTSAMGTAVGMVTDLTTGTIDRFCALPMWRSSVLVARSFADLLSAALCTTIVLATGLAVGWRPHAGVAGFVAGLGVALLFSYALCWACAALGVVSKGAESAQGVGLIILFPLALVSNAFVPTTGMPGWMQAIADWNPVSTVVAAARQLWGDPNPSHLVHAWPMQHPVQAALAWSLVILVVFAPLAAHLYRRRTTG